MSGDRPKNRGSFGGHLEELIKHFPAEAIARELDRPKVDSKALKEKIEIHAMLFQQAWRLERDEHGS